MKKGNVVLGIIILTLVLFISASTYAYWTWNSGVNKNVVFNTFEGIEQYIEYNEGTSYFVGNFQPTDTFCESASTTLSFYKSSEVADIPLTATINMDVNSIGSNIAASSSVYWVVTKGDNTISCDSGLDTAAVVNYGTFNGVSVTEEIPLTLAKNIEVTTTEQVFTVWIWIDSTASDLDTLVGDTIDTNIWTRIDMLGTEPEVPELDGGGMIPVTIADDGKVTTISKNNENWYNYSEKRWANAILVTADSREKYLGTAGVEVTSTDILAYYVWIPRYKYRIWATGASAVGGEQPIDIIFESKDAVMSTGTTVGTYRTHPAFWWNDNNDSNVDEGELLAGIWVAKFEISTSMENANCYNTTSTDYCNNTNHSPRVLPNVSSLRNIALANQFVVSQKFSISDNIYGLDNNNTDSHQMKNSEWGAVTYLAHSQYGINKQIRINNYYNSMKTLTGCGALTDDEVGATTCGITYSKATDYPQSTTGNISGIFDISGGAGEFVMANYNDQLGSSGFTEMPEKKYYDKYTVTTGKSHTLSISAGHAMAETYGWYGDYVTSNHTTTVSWTVRGGYNFNNSLAGAYTYISHSGGTYQYVGFRNVLINK